MVRTLEILWHCSERSNEAEQMGLQSCAAEGITSIDWCHAANRLLTTGGDRCIRIWDLCGNALQGWMEDGTKNMSSCVSHVSCMKSSWMPMSARWSPNGQLVASSHCDGKICLWWPERGGENGQVCLTESGEEIWKDFRHLSGHVNDVYDICFSPDSRCLVSAGGDGCVLVHDLEGSTMPVVQLSECHSKFCRGVSWDPWNRFLISFGDGPALQFFNHIPKRVGEGGAVRRMSLAGQRKSQGNFIGDTCSLFFRRMSWSPDGLFLAVPFGKAGHVTPLKKTALSRGTDGGSESVNRVEEEFATEPDMVHCVNLYVRNSLDKLAARIVIKGYSEVRGVAWAPCFLEPLGSKAPSIPHPFFNIVSQPQKGGSSVEVKCLGGGETASWGPKDYRLALAAWTPDAVIVYTTDSCVRHSDFTDLHMRSITDVAWAPDARYLLTASLDGYVSVVAFRNTLTTAHRLPLFSPSPAIKSMCDVFLGLQKIGIEVESSYNKFANNSPVSSVAAVVKKKKRTEKPVDALVEVSHDQLCALLDS